MRTLIRSAGLMVAASLVFTAVAAAQSDDRMASLLSRDLVYGAKAGLVSSGTVSIHDFVEFETDMSYSLGGFLDYRLGEKFFGGASLDLHNVAAQDQSETFIDLAVNLKAQLAGEESRVAFRPGFGLGYGSLGAVDEDLSGTNYFTVKGFVEAVIPTSGRLAWLGELVIYGAPSGGNSEADVTFGPMFLIRGGVLF